MTDQDQREGRVANAHWILLIICFALFFGVFNASAVVVVLPDIAADLSVDAGQVSWLMTGFLLVYGIAIPFYGRLADIYGARPLFLLGIGIFAIGSLLSALATDYSFMLAARTVQAVGGAAVPGLGMTLASRAYGPKARGTILGVIAGVIGAGGAIGPLLGGVLSETAGWQSIFFVSAAAAISIPVGLRILPGDDERTGGTLDVIGGIALALLVVGALLVPSEGARSGWSSALVVVGGVGAIIGLIVLIIRQVAASSPFIPRELLRNYRYDALLGMSFSVMAAYGAPLMGIPILLATIHALSPIEIGVTMLPGAVSSSVFGVLAGRLTDARGARLPTWLGSPLMLFAVLGLSTYAGRSVWVIAIFAGILGAGFGLMNTPMAATVSRIVRGQVLASGLSVNSMLFFLGGGFGTAGLIAVVTSRAGPAANSLNPLHSGEAAGFSDGFLILAIPVIVSMVLLLALPGVSRPAAVEPDVAVRPEPAVARNWVENCTVPWTPECVEVAANAPKRVASA